MIYLNFSHPITAAQREQIELLIGTPITREINAPAQFDLQQPFAPQLHELLTQIPLSPQDWQNEPLLINPPSLNFIAVMVQAELHGRMGYFAPCVRLRPDKDVLPPRYELAEILNLQAIRDTARRKR